MADRYDPKVSVRPLSERRPAQASADNDPLAELARIVSGRPPVDPPQGQPKARSGAGAPAVESGASDLEAELLNDLQASFAAVRDQMAAPPAPAAAPPAPQLRAAPPPPKPAPAAPSARAPSQAPLSRATPVADQRPAPVVREAPVQREAAPVLRDPVPAQRDPAPAQHREAAPPVQRESAPPAREPQHTARPQPAPEQPAARAVRPAAKAPDGAPPPVRIPAPVRPPLPSQGRQPPPQQPGVVDIPSFFRPSRNEARPERADVSAAPLRTTLPANPPRAENPPAPVRGASRWDPPEEPRREEPSRFAPFRSRSRAAPPPPQQDPAYDDVEDALLDDAAFADEAQPYEAEAPADDILLQDMEPPAFGEDELPPFPDDELEEIGRRRTRRVLGVAAALAGFVVIGGAGYYFLGSDIVGASPPPIIVADAGPNKVTPDATATDATDADGSKLSYDRVDKPAEDEESVLVATGDDAILPPIPEAESNSNNAITRVIIPGGPGFDGPLGEGDEGAAEGDAAVTTRGFDAEEAIEGEGDASVTAIGPRKVRTVVVKPDGTIVSSEAAEEGADAGATGDRTASADPALIVPPARTDMDAVLEGDSVAVDADPLGGAAAGTVPAADAAADAAAAADDAPPAAAEAEDFPDPPAAAPRPAPEPEARVAARSNPIDLAGSRNAAGSGGGTAGGVLVQVSSQRSEEAASSTFRDLQRRYPNILGTYQANIQRADLGDRGVYFRVRVGPFTASDAARLCESLKSAGGDCIIAR